MTYTFPKALIISEFPSDMRSLCAFFEKEGYDVFMWSDLEKSDTVTFDEAILLCVDVEIESTKIQSLVQSIFCNGLNGHLSLLLLNTSSNQLSLPRWLKNESLFLSHNTYSVSVATAHLSNRLVLQNESLIESAAFAHLCQAVGFSLSSYEPDCDYVSDYKEFFSYSFISPIANKFSLNNRVNCVKSEYFLDSKALKNSDPLPFLRNFADTVPGLKKHSKKLFMIVSELFSNALEHGLLELNSDLKDTPEGFSKYYSEKQKRLNKISSGFVLIKIHANYSLGNGVATVTVEDSGKGYNPDLIAVEANQEGVPYNRGLYLVRYLSEEVTVSAKGNKTTILFKWKQ